MGERQREGSQEPWNSPPPEQPEFQKKTALVVPAELPSFSEDSNYFHQVVA